MNVYRGDRRRQVGGNLFSTTFRGIKPLLLSLFTKLKPHLLDAGKSLGRKAATAALHAGSSMADKYMDGELNTKTAKEILKSEVKDLAKNVGKGYKRKLEAKLQTGSGKRRKVAKRKMPIRKSARKNINRSKKPIKRCKTKRCKTKSKRKVNKRTRRTVNRKRKLFKDIFGK